MRTKYLLAFPMIFAFGLLHAQNEIEDVRVETYYIADANDGTDEVGGLLAPGSRTHRVFLDLGEGCSLLAIYGDSNHVFTVESTAPFFNNLDRGRVYGHQISNNALDENTVALDSWLSMGAASNQKYGVEKSADTDGSIVGGTNNDGGSASIAGGMLVHANTDIGIPLTAQDGLIPLNGGTVPPAGYYVQGEEPTAVLADLTLSTRFSATDFIMGCSTPGVAGPTPENVVLLAQLTTTGELHFELNVLVRRPDGTTIRFVANDSILLADEQGFALLNYPPVCGCTDADYLEFDPGAGCDDGSCSTAIIFGCTDLAACNYDPDANFSVPQLCCYGINDCNGLDPYVVCPGVGSDEPLVEAPFRFYPNPVTDVLTIQWESGQAGVEVVLLDPLGRIVFSNTTNAPDRTLTLDVSTLSHGLYTLHVSDAARTFSRSVIKQ